MGKGGFETREFRLFESSCYACNATHKSLAHRVLKATGTQFNFIPSHKELASGPAHGG
jgi:hypothetical protein